MNPVKGCKLAQDILLWLKTIFFEGYSSWNWPEGKHAAIFLSYDAYKPQQGPI